MPDARFVSPLAASPAASANAAISAISAISAMSEMFTAATAMDRELDLLEVVAEQALQTVSAAALSLGKLVPDGTAVQTLVNVGELAPGEQRRPDDELYAFGTFPGFEQRLRSGEAHLCSLDDPMLPQVSRELLEWTRKHHAASVPVVVDGRLWGELWASRNAGAAQFSAEEIDYLSSVAHHAGVIIAASEDVRRLRAYAYRDDLTGLVNRRGMHEALDAALAACRAGAGPATVVMADVNGLKIVNDTSGHAAGDSVLRTVAVALREGTAHVRGFTAARTGGDEFCVIAQDADLMRTTGVVQPILDALAAAPQGIRVSAGAASTSTVGPGDSDALLRAADRALYVAKRTRTGWISVSPDDAGCPPGRGRDRRLLRRTRPR